MFEIYWTKTRKLHEDIKSLFIYQNLYPAWELSQEEFQSLPGVVGVKESDKRPDVVAHSVLQSSRKKVNSQIIFLSAPTTKKTSGQVWAAQTSESEIICCCGRQVASLGI